MTIDERTLEFFVAWAVDGLDISPGAVIEVGPYGEKQTRIKLWSKKDKKEQRLPNAKDELRMYFLYRVSKDALQKLNELESMIAPIMDDRFISYLSTKDEHEECLKNIKQHPDDPDSLFHLNEAIKDISKKEAMRFINYIRWRCVYDWDYSLPSSLSICWKSNIDSGWRQLIIFRIGELQVIDTHKIRALEPEFIHEIEENLSSECNIFFAYDLVCEATRLATTLPNLSLFEAYQAMEVGTKEAIARIKPDTEWLMFNMPSPSVDKLLRDYLPLIIDEQKKRN